jgi:hypothetical protein
LKGLLPDFSWTSHFPVGCPLFIASMWSAWSKVLNASGNWLPLTLVSSHWLTRLDQVQRGGAIGPEQNPSIFSSQMIQQQKVINTVLSLSLEDGSSIFPAGCFTDRKKFLC